MTKTGGNENEIRLIEMYFQQFKKITNYNNEGKNGWSKIREYMV